MLVRWPAVLAIVLALFNPELTYAQQSYPNRPIRLLTTEPGGGSDVMARLIAQGLTGSLGQQVIVENRPSGIILGSIASKATPDGYTMLLSGSGLWLVPLMQDAPFDPIKDFAAITLPARVPNVLVVHPSLVAKSAQELIALAKAKPGTLNYSSGSTGAIAHLAAELFNSKAGVSIVRVNYKGAGPALAAVVAGETQVMFPSAGSVSAHIAANRLRALAVTTAEPSDLVPGVPTLASSGLPGYEAVSPFGVFAPAATPKSVLLRLNKEIVQIVRRPDVKDRFFKMGMETVGSTGSQLEATIKAEVATWSKVISDAGLRDRASSK